jgi:hypothetical protein
MKLFSFTFIFYITIFLLVGSTISGSSNYLDLCVNGCVYKASTPQVGIEVRLYDGQTFLNSTTTNQYGWYSISLAEFDPGWYRVESSIDCDPPWWYYKSVDFYYNGSSDAQNKHIYLEKLPCDVK